MWKKFVYVLDYLESFKTVHKNNPQTGSPQENKKVMLATAAYFKVFTVVWSQRHWKRVYKTKKMNTNIEFCIFKLI